MSQQSDIDYLRDQARQLREHLSSSGRCRGQASFASDAVPAGDNDGDSSAAAAMSLLQEYDTLVRDLHQKLGSHTDEVRSLQLDVKRLMAENDRLTRDLKASVELQINALDPDVLRAAESDHDALELLRVQLQLTVEERNASEELSRAARLEVERLESELVALRRSNVSPDQWAQLQAQNEQMRAQFMGAIKELNSEVKAAQEGLRRSKAETRLAETQTAELRRLLEQLRGDAAGEESSKVTTLEEDVAAAKRHAGDLELRLAAAVKLCEDLNKEKTAVETKVTQVQKQCADHEHRAYEAATKVKDSLLMVDKVLLDKDQVMLRERQLEEEVARLREELSKLVHVAGVRTKQEVEKLRSVYNAKLARLLEDVHALEMENGERKAQLERAIREKRAVESELEKVYQEGMAASMKDGGRYDQLSKRACEAERQRDEASVRLDAVQGALKRVELGFAKEKSKWSSENVGLSERVEELTRDFHRVDGDRLRHAAELDEVEKKLLANRHEKEACERSYQRQLSCMEQEAARRQKEFETKLKSADDSHRQSMEQLRQTISSHQRMAAKWKDEYEESQLKSDRVSAEQRVQITDLKNRVEELRGLLTEARDKTIDSERMMSECTAQIRKMEARVRDADARAAEAMKQNASKEAKLRQLLHQEERGDGDSSLSLSRRALHTQSHHRHQDSRYRDTLRLADLESGNQGHLDQGILIESNHWDKPTKQKYTSGAIQLITGREGSKENLIDSPENGSLSES